jgi:uncharacterized protein YndB with AHSA1/START domain
MDFVAPTDLAGTPAILLPCGLSPDGLPYSIQFAGRRLSESVLCRIAAAYEQATDWHTRHPKTDDLRASPEPVLLELPRGCLRRPPLCCCTRLVKCATSELHIWGGAGTFATKRLHMDTFDRIEKQVVLRAPIARVWRAIANAKEFGRWFGLELDGDFVVGQPIVGTFNASLNEAAILDYQRKLGLPPSKVKLPEKSLIFCTVERIEAESYFSFRWIPYGIDAEVDPQTEPTTLVEFRLAKVAEGTLLTIVESGFDRVPARRRERAFRMNEAGWAGQGENIRKYIAKP